MLGSIEKPSDFLSNEPSKFKLEWFGVEEEIEFLLFFGFSQLSRPVLSICLKIEISFLRAIIPKKYFPFGSDDFLLFFSLRFIFPFFLSLFIGLFLIFPVPIKALGSWGFFLIKFWSLLEDELGRSPWP